MSGKVKLFFILLPTYLARLVKRRNRSPEAEQRKLANEDWWQCDQIGLFLKDLGYEFYCKSSPNFIWLLGYFVRCQFLIKNCCGYFLGNLDTFILTFNHTDWSLTLGKVFQLRCSWRSQIPKVQYLYWSGLYLWYF